jgi:hypothetical protein
VVLGPVSLGILKSPHFITFEHVVNTLAPLRTFHVTIGEVRRLSAHSGRVVESLLTCVWSTNRLLYLEIGILE